MTGMPAIITLAARRTTREAHPVENIVFFAAVPGTTVRTAVAWRVATTTRHRIASGSTDFDSSGTWIKALYGGPFTLCTDPSEARIEIWASQKGAVGRQKALGKGQRTWASDSRSLWVLTTLCYG
jgi:hypothetical protein